MKTVHKNNTSTCTESATVHLLFSSFTEADVGVSKIDLQGGQQSKWFAAEGQQRLTFTRILAHQSGGVHSPCFLKILVIVSCTCCCNFALLKLKLPWRETKQMASVRDQETSIKH